jgi:hypothetical protein
VDHAQATQRLKIRFFKSRRPCFEIILRSGVRERLVVYCEVKENNQCICHLLCTPIHSPLSYNVKISRIVLLMCQRQRADRYEENFPFHLTLPFDKDIPTRPYLLTLSNVLQRRQKSLALLEEIFVSQAVSYLERSLLCCHSCTVVSDVVLPPVQNPQPIPSPSPRTPITCPRKRRC